MIDFFKVVLDLDTIARLQADPRFDFRCKVSEQTGEIRLFPKVATLSNLVIIMRSESYCELFGSLHKFAQDGVNYTDFTFQSVAAAIHRLRDEYGIDIYQAKLRNLEVGVNLEGLPVATETFIRSVLTHRGEAFHKMRTKGLKSIGIELYHQRYAIKVYDKAKQCKLLYSLLRFEVKYTKMEDLKRLGIVTLSDLTKHSTLAVLGSIVLRRFDELLISEPFFQLDRMKPAERRKLAKYENPKYWEDLKEQDRKRHDYYRKRYRKLIEKYVPNPIQQQVSRALKDKIEQLSVDTENLAKLTDAKNQKLSQINPLSNQLKTETVAQRELAGISLSEDTETLLNDTLVLAEEKRQTASRQLETITVFDRKVTNEINEYGYPTFWDE